ncbi:MAG: EAL domain-containing protein [Paracoccus sp. (in: a-proteobacteria)]
MHLSGLLTEILGFLHLGRGQPAPLRIAGHPPSIRRPLSPISPPAALHFWPQLCCDTGRIASIRAVPPSRLQGDTGGVLRLSLDQVRAWRMQGLRPPEIAIPLSLRAVESAEEARLLLWEIDRQETDAGRLIFCAPSSNGRSIKYAGLSLLAQSGCGIELDCLCPDLMARMQDHRPGLSRMRIAPAFVQGCHRNPHRGQLALSLLALAERHGLSSIAEGIATREEHGFLAQLGCDIIQGEAVAPLLDGDGTAHFLHATSRPQPRMNLPTRPAA